MRMFRLASAALLIGSLVLALPAAAAPTPGQRGSKFTHSEVVQAATGFFGATSEAIAKATQKVFSDYGLPDAYIKGDEGSGAIVVGLRYGSGWLIRKGYEPVKVYWQGPSVGFDLGATAAMWASAAAPTAFATLC